MMKISAPLFQLRVGIPRSDKLSDTVQEFHKDGLTFIEGRQGSRFELGLTNLTDRRILVHPTVDGLSAMTGKEASKNDSTHGYVLRPHETTFVPGWRLNDMEVAQFFFAGAGKSYAEEKGGGADKGVIACAVWEEIQLECRIPKGILRGSSCVGRSLGAQSLNIPVADVGAAGASYCCNTERHSDEELTTGNLGTGFGESVEHEVQTTHFVAATSEPSCVAVIYYDDLKGLRARGIKISQEEKTVYSLPNPFPKDKDVGCEPPPNWEDPSLRVLVQKAMMALLKLDLPVESLRIPIKLKRKFSKDAIREGRILGVPFEFYHGGNEVVAVSPEVYGRKSVGVDC